MDVIAERLKEIRVENSITQQQLGKILSVSQDTISLWENGKSQPTIEYVVKICKVFQTSADYLLGLSDY